MRKDWEVKKLGDLSISLKNGLTIKQNKSCCGIPVTRIETLSNGIFNRDKLGYANIYDKEQYSDYILDDKDLLISHINSKQYVGRAVLYRIVENESIIHGMNLLRLKLNNEFALPEFIAYYFKSSYIKEQIRKYRKDAVNQSSISITDIKKIRLFVPPLQTQQQIVEELDCLTSIIEKQKKQLEELDNLAQAIFYDMFGDPIENEKRWKIVKFRDIGNVQGGYAFKSSSFVDTGIPILKIGNINSGFFKKDNISFYKYDSSLRKYEIHPNDLVISMTGTIGKEDYGNICIIPFDYELYYLNQRNAKLIVSDSYNSFFLSYVLKDNKVKYDLTKNSKGVRQANISNNDILDLNLISPPLTLQQQFASKIEAIEKQKELIKKSIKETEDLFNSRMDYYFN